MKDPAILFYTSDFLTGTMTMTNEEVGMYIRLLCLQHQKNRLSAHDFSAICCGKSHPAVDDKFKRDPDGFFNERMDAEMVKRKGHNEHQRQNALMRWHKSRNAVALPSHKVGNAVGMPLEDEDEDEDVNAREDVNASEKDREVQEGKGKPASGRQMIENRNNRDIIVTGDGKRIDLSIPRPAGTDENGDWRGVVGSLREPAAKPRRKVKEFIRPTQSEVTKWIATRKIAIDPVLFFSTYEANGWTINGTPVASWRALAIKWGKNGAPRQTNGKAPASQGRYGRQEVDAETLKGQADRFLRAKKAEVGNDF